jgi:hypothetical protein
MWTERGSCCDPRERLLVVKSRTAPRPPPRREPCRAPAARGAERRWYRSSRRLWDCLALAGPASSPGVPSRSKARSSDIAPRGGTQAGPRSMTYSAMRKEERGTSFLSEALSRPVDRRAMRRGRDLLTPGRVGRRGGRAIRLPFSNLAPARTSVTRWGWVDGCAAPTGRSWLGPPIHGGPLSWLAPPVSG